MREIMVDFETKCIICGSDLEKTEDSVLCPQCSFSEQNSVSKTDMTALSEAFAMLGSEDYKVAYDMFAKFVKKHSDKSVGYFGMMLAKYCVKEYNKDSVTLTAVRSDSVLVDVDYVSAVKYATHSLREYIISVANLIEDKRLALIADADIYKPYSIAVYGDKDSEIYHYLQSVGYDVYSDSIASNVDEILDNYNVVSNAKMLCLVVNTEEDLVKYQKSHTVSKYIDKINLRKVATDSLVVVSTMSKKDIKKYIPEASILDADKKTILFDIESIAKTSVGEVEKPVELVNVKGDKKDTTFNTAGFNMLIRGFAIPGIILALVIAFMYTFTGNHYLIMGIGLSVVAAFMATVFVLTTITYVKATKGAIHMVLMLFSALLMLYSGIGIVSSFTSNAGYEWCYRGYWYNIAEDKTVSVANVDYYHTFLHRDIEIPETILGNKVTSFTIKNHSDVYTIVNVSEYLEHLTIIDCSSLRDVTVSVMGGEKVDITIDGCKKLSNVAIKNCDTIDITLKDLEELDTLTLYNIRVMGTMALDNVAVGEIWLPETLEKMTKFTVANIDALSVYVYNEHNASIIPALSKNFKFTSNTYRHPNDSLGSGKLYSRHVYPKNN